MNHRETGSFTPSIKYHRAVPRIPAVLLKVYLKGLDSPKALRADIVFEPRKRERERVLSNRTRRILRDHSFTRLASFVKRAPVKKATVNWVLGIHLVADNLPVTFSVRVSPPLLPPDHRDQTSGNFSNDISRWTKRALIRDPSSD